MKEFIAILLVLFSYPAMAQYTLSQELKFVRHLVGQEEYSDAVYYIDSKFNRDFSLPVRDSLNYFKGWSHYAMKELNQSASSLMQVSSDSPFFYESRFFAAYNYAHLGIVPLSGHILKTLDVEGFLDELRHFELAGNALLERDLPAFEANFSEMESSQLFSFGKEKENFKKYYAEIRAHKKKSVWAGGVLSAALPGAGKVYAGKTGEGIASFLIVAASGATAYENYKKSGFKNAKTILFGSLFAVLYIGNIYGSVFTVKLANEEFNHEMDHKILFNMHIPLRNFFN